MAYKNNKGEIQHTLKEKIAYHNECANTGKKPDGTKLTFTERQNHARASAKCRGKLKKFMNSVNTVERVNKTPRH